MPSRNNSRPESVILRGLGGYVPPKAVSNFDLERRLDTSDEWIRTRTGIASRRFVEPGVATSDLATEAGRRAFESAGTDEVDLVILATSTPDHPCPATAPTVASRLGLGTVAAFDLAAVCSGFVYALSQASSAILSGQHRSVLVIGADTFSTIIDPEDRSTAIIFGDGAGAVLLGAGSKDQPGRFSSFDLRSDGRHRELIQIKGGGSRLPASLVSDESDRFLAMRGKEVFVEAVTAMAQSSRRVLEDTGWRPDDVDWLVAHQANQRILNRVASVIGIPAERAVIHLDRVGNTSAASIPLALAAHAPSLKVDDRLLLTAFGGGTTWGSATLSWPGITVQDPHDRSERELPCLEQLS